jgi:hypothetical protein
VYEYVLSGGPGGPSGFPAKTATTTATITAATLNAIQMYLLRIVLPPLIDWQIFLGHGFTQIATD